MRVRLGLGIASEAVRAVVVRGGTAVWCAEVELRGSMKMADAVLDLLGRAPLSRWPRPIVCAALGPSLTQTRRLEKLPPARDAHVLTRLVRENAERFFLRRPVLVAAQVGLDARGATGAVADGHSLAMLTDTCRAARLPLALAVPTVTVLGHAFESARCNWRDGAVTAEVDLEGRRFVDARQRRCASAETAAGPSVSHRVRPELATLGADAWKWADAYGAAVVSRRPPLCFPLERHTSADRRRTHLRLGAATAAFVVALLVLLLAPGVAASRARDEAQRRLEALGPARRQAVAAQEELQRVTSALAEAAAFDMRRHSVTELLATFAAVLPEATAMIALRVDSTAGTMVAVTPRAAALLSRLDLAPGIASAEIVGPVTREVIAGRQLERVSVRFRLVMRGAPRPTPRSNP